MHLCEVGRAKYIGSIALLGWMAWAPLRAQTAVGEWQYHAPFREVARVAVVGDQVLGMSRYGLLHLAFRDRVVTSVSTVEALSGVGLTALTSAPDGRSALIGYEDGRIDWWTPAQVRTVDDIPRSGQFQGRTAVRAFAFASPSRVFAASDFGVVELDLDFFAVRGTYRMRTDSEPTTVHAVAVSGDSIYAATELGLRTAWLQAPLYLPASWRANGRFADSVVTSLAANNGALLALSAGRAYVRNGGIWTPLALPSDNQEAQRACACGDQWAVVRAFDVRLFDSSGNPTSDLSGGYAGNDGFEPKDLACGLVGQDGRPIRWAANPRRGLTMFDNPNYVQHFGIAGPRGPQAFDVRWEASRGLTVLTGATEGPWTPLYLNDGIYRLASPGADWSLVDGPAFNGAKDLLEVATNPADPQHWFAASWGGGILEFRNGALVQQWTAGNSSLRAANGAGPADVRCGGLVWGQDGALWATNSLSDVPLHRYDPATQSWQGFAVGPLNGQSIKQIRQASNGDFWVQTRAAGLVAVKVQGGAAASRVLAAGTGNGGLPSPNVGAFTFTPDGRLWIGTASGLAVLYSPRNAFTGGPFEAQPLLVEADGRVQAVLAGQNITSIEVDGGNRKWVGTSNAGLFLLSPDGLQQLANFRSDNSPLATNRINGIALDVQDGYAYIATNQGLYSVRSGAPEVQDRMDDALLFPNPYRPEFRGFWTVTGLVEGCYVKVTTADGRRVGEGYASGGSFVWDTNDPSGRPVPSGLYQFWINDPLGARTRVLQGLLVRP